MKLYAAFYQYGEKIQMEHALLYSESIATPGAYNSAGRLENKYFDSFADFIRFLKNNDITELSLSYGNISANSIPLANHY